MSYLLNVIYHVIAWESLTLDINIITTRTSTKALYVTYYFNEPKRVLQMGLKFIPSVVIIM
jgi:hypothetical protein